MLRWFWKLKGAFFIILFCGIALYVFSLNFKYNKIDTPQKVLLAVTVPLFKIYSDIFKTASNYFHHYLWLINVEEENTKLKRKIAELENKVVLYHEAYLQNQRLKRLLEFRGNFQYSTIPAIVVLHDLTGWFQTVIINKGSEDGIQINMPVVSYEAVVGKIMNVGKQYARVMLITDPASAVDVLVQRSRIRGILAGKNLDSCKLKYVRNDMDVRPGDLLITSGKDGIFPPGLRVGVVEATYPDPVHLFQRIEVKPLANIKDIEEVLVIKMESRKGISTLMKERTGGYN
ncbi:MAG: rod shape-determining protein MreC [Deltaproteobacteria bacterium]|nr:rod shape-determining protein MreC [Deltaproteobacteria bacterium]MBW2069374.1 rod shape-determining protein MreC [Deltaproteobacteria bacterium]